MLNITVNGFDTAVAPLWTLEGMVGRLLTVSSAYVSRLSSSAGVPVGEGRVDGYHRWAEPVALLAARGIQTALSTAEAPESSLPGFRLLVTVSLNSQMLIKVPAAILDGQLVMSGERRFPVNAKCGLGWELAAMALCADATGATQLPPLPEAIRPPVYEYDGFSYCRTSDLPPEARLVFERDMSGSTVPFVPGFRDAVFPWDIGVFLGQKV